MEFKVGQTKASVNNNDGPSSFLKVFNPITLGHLFMVKIFLVLLHHTHSFWHFVHDNNRWFRQFVVLTLIYPFPECPIGNHCLQNSTFLSCFTHCSGTNHVFSHCMQAWSNEWMFMPLSTTFSHTCHLLMPSFH